MSLLNIQSELKAPKNQYNSFGKYKYRSTEDILEAVKPLLLKYECVMTISDTIQEKAGIIFCESSIKFAKSSKNKSLCKTEADLTFPSSEN